MKNNFIDDHGLSERLFRDCITAVLLFVSVGTDLPCARYDTSSRDK